MNTAAQAVSDVAACSATRCSFRPGAALTTNTKSGWAATEVLARLRVLRNARHRMAAQAEEFAAAISKDLPRTKSDTVVSELMPLLDACKFLEKKATQILAPRKLGRSGRPFWLSGVRAEVHREPLGHVLVIGPANFPLFLPGAQVLQALAAGNTVTWKPGRGGAAVARLVAQSLCASGLPDDALRITDETVEAAQVELESSPDKVVFTGSADAGRAVLHILAESTTPAVVELSGADAVIVMPNADLEITAKAIAFGLRLNGGQVCMSPRRVFAKLATLEALKPLLVREFAKIPPAILAERSARELAALCAQARALGARVEGAVNSEAQRPLMIEDARPEMDIARTDIFAPVLSLISVSSLLELPEMYQACPYALTLAIFCSKGEEPQARGFAKILRAGTVLINDLIAPTADPRVPFGGRGASGYGTTRGAEGLLEMTAAKTILVRRGGRMRHLDATTDEDLPLFTGLLRAAHGGGWRERWQGVMAVMASASKAKARSKEA